MAKFNKVDYETDALTNRHHCARLTNVDVQSGLAQTIKLPLCEPAEQLLQLRIVQFMHSARDDSQSHLHEYVSEGATGLCVFAR